MIHVKVSQSSAHVQIGSQTVVIEDRGDPYEGEYDVTPDFTTQTLDTENKFMEDDVTVHPIPVHRTSNPYGTTVYIGGILDG